MALLSTVLVFKDILPAYRIREEKEEARLKKGTQKLREFERALLRAYQRFLSLLAARVRAGLCDPRHSLSNGWNSKVQLGLSALRCECELLRSAPYFNFRQMLLTSVVSRAMQPEPRIHTLCCDTITKLFERDVEGEVSYEAVRLVAKTLEAVKYNVPEPFLRLLESVKLRVSSAQGRAVRCTLKKERRKRKKDEDDIEAGLAETDHQAAKNSAMKFQADSLHEIALIYFRIVKRKVGFRLFPAALDGLSRISHLINLETVEDLVTALRELVMAKAPPAPMLLRLSR